MEITTNTSVKFKKKSIKGNLRKKEIGADAGNDSTDDKDRDETNEEIAGEDTINFIKYQQNMRMKKSGLSHDKLQKKNVKKTSNNGEEWEPNKNIDTVMSNQFAVDKGDGYGTGGNGHAHEKIMEQYVNSKMGLDEKAESKLEKKELTEEEKLYKIPGQINSRMEKVVNNTSASSAKGESDINGISSSWAAGIAEVALPMNFKLKNIEETEAAAALDREARKGGKEKGTGYYQRFQVVDSNRGGGQNKGQQQQKSNANAESSTSQSQNNNNNPNKDGLKRSQMSHDDISFDRYKKAQQKFRR